VWSWVGTCEFLHRESFVKQDLLAKCANDRPVKNENAWHQIAKKLPALHLLQVQSLRSVLICCARKIFFDQPIDLRVNAGAQASQCNEARGLAPDCRLDTVEPYDESGLIPRNMDAFVSIQDEIQLRRSCPRNSQATHLNTAQHRRQRLNFAKPSTREVTRIYG
jgi:hypothetical protein